MVKTWLTAHNEIQFSLSRTDRSIIVCTAQTANNYVRYSSKTVRLPVIAHCSVKPAKLKPWVETGAIFDASDEALPDGFSGKVEYGQELRESDLLESVLCYACIQLLDRRPPLSKTCQIGAFPTDKFQISKGATWFKKVNPKNEGERRGHVRGKNRRPDRHRCRRTPKPAV